MFCSPEDESGAEPVTKKELAEMHSLWMSDLYRFSIANKVSVTSQSIRGFVVSFKRHFLFSKQTRFVFAVPGQSLLVSAQC